MDLGTTVEEFQKQYATYSVALPNGEVQECLKPARWKNTAEEVDVRSEASCPMSGRPLLGLRCTN